MNIEEHISKLQEFIDEISIPYRKLPLDQAIQNNLTLYRGLLILIKELYELHLAPSFAKTHEEINKEKKRKISRLDDA